MTEIEDEKWISVTNVRKSAKLALEKGAMKIKLSCVKLEKECQIEYTQIRVSRKTSYTFSIDNSRIGHSFH